MRVRLVCALGVLVWPMAAAARQPAGVPPELRAHLTQRFDVVSSINGLPLGVRTELRTLFGSQTLDIADPGAPLRSAETTPGTSRPGRRLVAAGCSREDCLLYYERVASARTWRVVVIHWAPNATRLEWGGTAPGGFTTIDQVRSAVLSGAIKGSAGPW